MGRNRYYAGPPTDHFDGMRFFNPGQPTSDKSWRDLLRWRFGETRTAWVREPPGTTGDRVCQPATAETGLVLSFVGHASLLLQAAGVNVLVDPVWSDRASPVQFAGPRRFDPPGIRFEDLPPIQAVLLTHSHYDHMDGPTLTRLQAVHGPLVIAPLGNDAVLAGAAPGCRVWTGDWGSRVEVGGVAVSLHPAHHWSARRARDRRMALWCGFVVQSAAGTAYVAGDTGYGDGAPFRLVRARFGPPDVAVLPIGAYAPRWFMRTQHADPDEAVRMMEDCGAAQGLGVHWGTFCLTDEPRFEPAALLAQACRQRGMPADRFVAMRPGHVWRGG